MFKRMMFLILLLSLAASLRAQDRLSILFVDDDNYSSGDHRPRIETAITDAGYSYTIFDAQAQGRTPTAAEMAMYDLVFWYNANDGAGGYFWNGTDTLNMELKTYLDNGGMVWAMGNDIIYDMFGGAPDTFQAGDFLYDYFGVERYDAQSKADDGGSGVPMLLKAAGQEIASLDTVNWYVSGLWYGDGCTPVAGAVPVYEFGDASYSLAGLKTAIWYDNGTSKTMGTYFDAYYIDTAENRATFFKDILDHFDSFVSHEPPVAGNKYYLNFDGIDDYLKYDDESSAIALMDSAENYTIECWVYPKSGEIHNKVLLKRWYQFALTMYQDDKRRFYFTHYGKSGNTFVNTIDSVLEIGKWNHLAVVCNADSNWTKVYVNGKDVTLQHYDALTLKADSDNDNLYVGYGASGTYPNAYMDEIRLSNVARSITELNYSDLDSSYETDANTAVLFHFDEGSGSMTVNAASDSGYQARLGGSTIGDDQEPLWVEWTGKPNEAPMAFNLVAPANGDSVLITNDAGSSPVFIWNTAADVDGNLQHYSFYLMDEAGNALSDTTTTDTSFALPYDIAVDLLSETDTLLTKWTVSASDPDFTTASPDTFLLTFVKESNQPPSAPVLLLPQNNKSMFFTAGLPTAYHFSWEASASTDPVTYHFEIFTKDDVSVIQIDTSATELFVDLSAHIASTGQDSIELQWDVSAEASGFDVYCENGPYDFMLVKQVQSVLFVNDDNYGNYGEAMCESFDNIGLLYEFFDCGLEGDNAPADIPDYQTLAEYDIVFWFTGKDGKNDAIWMGADTTNYDLMDYLDAGGKLWLNGNDFLYDLYGGAPDTFARGDFVYDYLGVSSYDAQSKKDDGGSGLPLIVLDAQAKAKNVSTQDTLSWRFSGLWYADAVTLVEGAHVIYHMGPDDYALAGAPTMIYYPTDKFITVSSFFNVHDFDTSNEYEMRETFLFDVLSWLQHEKLLTGIEDVNDIIPGSFFVQQNYPNPFNPTTTIQFGLPNAGKVKIAVFNVLGQEVISHTARKTAGVHNFEVDASNWSSGLYFYRLQFAGNTYVKKMMLIK